MFQYQQPHYHMIFPSPHQHYYPSPVQFGPPAPFPIGQQPPLPIAYQVRGPPATQHAHMTAGQAYGTPRPSEYRAKSPTTKAAAPAAAGGPPNRTQVNVEVSHM